MRPTSVAAVTPLPDSHQMNPRRKKLSGGIPYIPDFASPRTGLTPSKMAAKKISEGKVNRVVLERHNSCSGRPARIHKFNVKENGNKRREDRYRRLCDHCKKYMTSWYCLTCKQWFCIETKKERDDFNLMTVCIPVKLSKEELEEEEEKKKRDEQKMEKKRKQGKDASLNERSNKKKKKSNDNFNLEEMEQFEESCWAKRHKCAWQRADGLPSDDEES